MKDITYFEKPKGSRKWAFRFERPSVDGKRKRVQRTNFPTKEAAMLEAKREYAKYYGGGEQEERKREMSYSDFLNHIWLKNHGVDLKQSTINNYQKIIRNKIEPTIGKYQLSAITREQLQDFLVDLYDEGLSLNTIGNIKALLTSSFSYAYDEKYIQHLPTARLKIPKNRNPKTVSRANPNSYIPKEIRDRIFERFPERSAAHIPLKLGLECGLRRGEVFGLTWDDVDFDQKTLTVCRQEAKYVDKNRSTTDKQKSNGSSECGDGYWYLGATKTKTSKRTIDLSDDMVDLLKREKTRQEKATAYYGEYYRHYYLEHGLFSDVPQNRILETPTENPVHFVCVEECGKRLTYHTVEHATSVIKRDIAKYFTFHSCRHTHATTLAELGLPDVYIQNRLGHSTPLITVSVYEHISDTLRQQGLNRINEYYRCDETIKPASSE